MCVPYLSMQCTLKYAYFIYMLFIILLRIHSNIVYHVMHCMLLINKKEYFLSIVVNFRMALKSLSTTKSLKIFIIQNITLFNHLFVLQACRQ